MERLAAIQSALGEPYFSDGGGRLIYCADSRELLPAIPTESIDLLLADPPYGMNWNTDTRRFSGGKFKIARGAKNRPIAGDAEPFDPSLLLRFRKVVLWGFNHFASRVPLGSTLVWQKKPIERFGNFLSDAELAWEKGGHGVYCFSHVWEGVVRQSERGTHLHPTQKPVALMEWCIQRNDREKPCEVILDPYAGSGPTLAAAKRLGRSCVAIELDEAYCEAAANRLRQRELALA